MSQVVTAALHLYARHPAMFALLAVAVVAPFELIVLAVTGTAPLGQQRAHPGTAFTLLLLDAAFVGPLISALYIQAVVAFGAERQASLWAVALRGVRVLPVVAAAQIVAGIGIALGLLALLVPGVILAVRWAVVAQAAAFERIDWLGALRRSFELTRGHFLYVLAVIVLITAINVVLTLAGQAIAGSGKDAGDVVLGIAIETVTRSFAALATAILYFDLRARQRGEEFRIPRIG